MKAAIYRHDYIMCPHCGEESGCRVDHLYNDPSWTGRGFGPWYCEVCRFGFTGRVDAPGDVTIEKVPPGGDRFSRSMALLRLDGKKGPVFFVMDHDRYWPRGGGSDAENQDHQSYLFEEGSCPTNWLGECVAVIENGDDDPHGFMTFVRAADVPQDFDADTADWRQLFPEAYEAIEQVS